MAQDSGSAKGSFFKGGCACTFIFLGAIVIFAMVTSNQFTVPFEWFLLVFLIGGVGGLANFIDKNRIQPQPTVGLETQERHCPYCLALIDPLTVVDTACPNCHMTLPTALDTKRATEAMVQYYSGAYGDMSRM